MAERQTRPEGAGLRRIESVRRVRGFESRDGSTTQGREPMDVYGIYYALRLVKILGVVALGGLAVWLVWCLS